MPSSALVNIDGELLAQLDEVRERLRKRGDCRASYSCAVRELLGQPHKNCRSKAAYRPLKFIKTNSEADLKKEVYHRIGIIKETEEKKAVS